MLRTSCLVLALANFLLAHGAHVLYADEPAEFKHGSGQSVRLEPAVLLFHKPHHTSGVKSVQRAAALGCQRINVVVTMLCRLDEDFQVLGYGMLLQGKYIPLDEARLAEFRYAIQETFREAVAQGIEISIVAHLNSWGEINEWRNYFLFDPLESLDGYSYREAVIQPILDALHTAEVPMETTSLSLVGEMGRSAFKNATQYRQIIEQLRSDSRSRGLSLGVSLNFNRVAGDVETSNAEQVATQKLVDSCDYLGMSNYLWFDLPPTAGTFSEGVGHFLKVLKENGVTVSKETPLQFTEVGIGGGNEDGKPAVSPEVAAQSPWQGSDRLGPNPWQTPEMIRLRTDYYRALLEFLRTQPASHRVERAFMWSEGSWDPMDVSGAGYGDEEITRMIQRHNAGKPARVGKQQ